MGVKINPHGNPHHPKAEENAIPQSLALAPQPWQESRGVLFQDVVTNADQTECDV
jgi:hypothetical protein